MIATHCDELLLDSHCWYSLLQQIRERTVHLFWFWSTLLRVQTWRDVGAFLQPPVPIASQLPATGHDSAAAAAASGTSASTSSSANVQLASWPSSTRASVALSRFLARSFDSRHVLFLPPPGSTVRRVERELACMFLLVVPSPSHSRSATRVTDLCTRILYTRSRRKENF